MSFPSTSRVHVQPGPAHHSSRAPAIQPWQLDTQNKQITLVDWNAQRAQAQQQHLLQPGQGAPALVVGVPSPSASGRVTNQQQQNNNFQHQQQQQQTHYQQSEAHRGVMGGIELSLSDIPVLEASLGEWQQRQPKTFHTLKLMSAVIGKVLCDEREAELAQRLQAIERFTYEALVCPYYIKFAIDCGIAPFPLSPHLALGFLMTVAPERRKAYAKALDNLRQWTHSIFLKTAGDKSLPRRLNLAENAFAAWLQHFSQSCVPFSQRAAISQLIAQSSTSPPSHTPQRLTPALAPQPTRQHPSHLSGQSSTSAPAGSRAVPPPPATAVEAAARLQDQTNRAAAQAPAKRPRGRPSKQAHEQTRLQAERLTAQLERNAQLDREFDVVAGQVKALMAQLMGQRVRNDPYYLQRRIAEIQAEKAQANRQDQLAAAQTQQQLPTPMAPQQPPPPPPPPVPSVVAQPPPPQPTPAPPAAPPKTRPRFEYTPTLVPMAETPGTHAPADIEPLSAPSKSAFLVAQLLATFAPPNSSLPLRTATSNAARRIVVEPWKSLKAQIISRQLEAATGALSVIGRPPTLFPPGRTPQPSTSSAQPPAMNVTPATPQHAVPPLARRPSPPGTGSSLGVVGLPTLTPSTAARPSPPNNLARPGSSSSGMSRSGSNGGSRSISGSNVNPLLQFYGSISQKKRNDVRQYVAEKTRSPSIQPDSPARTAQDVLGASPLAHIVELGVAVAAQAVAARGPSGLSVSAGPSSTFEPVRTTESVDALVAPPLVPVPASEQQGELEDVHMAEESGSANSQTPVGTAPALGLTAPASDGPAEARELRSTPAPPAAAARSQVSSSPRSPIGAPAEPTILVRANGTPGGYPNSLQSAVTSAAAITTRGLTAGETATRGLKGVPLWVQRAGRQPTPFGSVSHRG